MKKDKIAIFWLRRDLRLDDNKGLYNALKSGYPVLPVYAFGDNTFKSKNPRQLLFLHKELRDLKDKLKLMGSDLFVMKGNAVDMFKFLLEKYEVKVVFYNLCYEPGCIKADNDVKEILKFKGVGFYQYQDSFIFDKNDILKSDGKPYLIYSPYKNAFSKKLTENILEEHLSEKYSHAYYKVSETFEFPETASFGVNENEKIDFLEKLINYNVIENYAQTRDFPAMNGTTRLGVHLCFGTISIRKLFNAAMALSSEYTAQLIWREFFVMLLTHFPQTVNYSFKRKYDNIKWLNNENDFHLWKNGQTGFPIVDAGMNQLNKTGYMHNRVRMVTASFLCKHLLIDWRWGEAYFSEKLIDFELSSNVGSWQWCAGSGSDAAPYFRIFNPLLQQKKFDPKNEYIDKWLPENYYAKVKPVIEHDSAVKRCKNVYKAALQ